jgi:ring-1,2-phenylacetyl-CoA epoxidase subunit PaaC
MRYAEWCTAAPSLEADIAAAAMGLDDLGHSRVLYGCLSELGEAPPVPDTGYTNLAYLDRPWSEWNQFVAANAVLDSAFTLMIEALASGNVEVLRSRLRKMIQEERYHFMHGRSWLRESAANEAVATAWREAIEWFGPEQGDLDDLHREGKLGFGLSELRARLQAQLERPAPQVTIDWKGWDPVSRRTQPGRIDEATLEMLRGLAEKRYMPAGGERKEA